MRYGMPYKGSKNKIAQKIIDRLPPAKHFYDLFGGGGAITHCALLSGKYEIVHYNELNPLVCKAFKMAINGEFKNENRWISREDFFKLKDTDPYVAVCFSFANKLKDYCYDRKIELFKKAFHYSIFYNDNRLLSKIINVNDINYTDNNLHNRRICLQHYLKKYIKKIEGCCNTDNNNPRNILQSLERLERLQRLQSLENLQRLQSLENLQRLQSLENLEITNLDYRDIKIEKDSVVYCDIPYKGTDSYA